jgi:hypothetical protein
MSAKVHNFQKSLKIGKKAENEFFELFKDKVEQLDGYVADFKILKNGKTIELKTDSYDPTKTPNLFAEKFSYNEEPGGAFQALKKGTDYYVYWFPITMEFFVYKTSSLVDKLNELYPDPWLINIRNQAHITRGFLVKRELLNKIRIPLEDIL